MANGKTDGAPHILIENVAKTYASPSGDVRALTDVSLSIRNGEFISLLGPSGCGKSTLLRLIAGLDTVTAGTVSLAGKAIAGPPVGLGMVFQKDVLLDWRTVLQNVLLPVERMQTSEVPTIPMYYTPTITPYPAGLHGPQLRTGGNADTLLKIWEWEWRS